jgi:hypothetical protein
VVPEVCTGDTVLEGLGKDAREATKGLWADPQQVPPGKWRKRQEHLPLADSPSRNHQLPSMK